MRGRRGVGGEEGFALVAALWLLVAISVVAMDFSLEGRDRRLLAANRVEGVRARYAADAGLEHGRAFLEALLRDGADLLSPAAGRGDPWADAPELGPVEGGEDPSRYSAALIDLGARLNVNEADEETIRRFLVAVGIDAGRADRLAQTIPDWRDPDDLRRARGAEAREYEEAGAAVLPPNRPLASVEELRRVDGMREEDFERIEPMLTVRGTGRINLASAPVPVLLSLPGMHGELVSAILEHRRRRQPVPSIAELSASLSPDVRTGIERYLPELVSRTTPDTRELLIRSEGRIEGSPVRSVIEVVAVRSQGAVFLVERGES